MICLKYAHFRCKRINLLGTEGFQQIARVVRHRSPAPSLSREEGVIEERVKFIVVEESNESH